MNDMPQPQPDPMLDHLHIREKQLLGQLGEQHRDLAATQARLEEIRDLIAKAEQKKRGRPRKVTETLSLPAPQLGLVETAS